VHYRRDGKMSEGNNKKNVSEDILWDSVRERVRQVRKHPAKVLLVPPLCATYLLLIGGLYANMLMYHVYVYNKGKRRF
jgi:hypothetical protein